MLAMEEIRQGRRTNNEARRIRGWKLFLLILGCFVGERGFDAEESPS